MIYNDWRRTMDSMAAAEGSADGMGIRLLRFRQAMGYSHEATEFLKSARKKYPTEIDRFMQSLAQDTRDEYDKVFTALAPVKRRARRHRNVTFHYPKMAPPEKIEAGKDLFAKALAAAAKDTSSATLGPKYRDLRFDFADAIVVHLLGFKFPEQEGEFRKLVVALREAQLALGQFVLGAVSTYLGWRPPGGTSRYVPRSVGSLPPPISQPRPESARRSSPPPARGAG
jgi:hypothetical protein